MADSLILERLTTNNKILDVVSKRLDVISDLFSGSPKEKIVPTLDGFIYSETVKAKTIYQSADMTVTVGEYALQGDVWPDHNHSDSVEFLIVGRGMFLLKIEGTPRIMKKGDCASIPAGVKHSVMALSDGSSIVGICVPPEKAYLIDKLENITWQTSHEKNS